VAIRAWRVFDSDSPSKDLDEARRSWARSIARVLSRVSPRSRFAVVATCEFSLGDAKETAALRGNNGKESLRRASRRSAGASLASGRLQDAEL